MEELNRLTEYVYANVGNPFVCNEITKALNELQAHIRTEVDELKIELADSMLYSADLKDDMEKGAFLVNEYIGQQMEAESLLTKLRSLEAEGKEQAK